MLVAQMQDFVIYLSQALFALYYLLFHSRTNRTATLPERIKAVPYHTYHFNSRFNQSTNNRAQSIREPLNNSSLGS